MVFRADTVQARLLRLEEVVSELRELARLDSATLRTGLLAGFRNILVHDYLRLDPNRVEEALARAPQDFDDFARSIRLWLEGRTSP